jgi:two-component system NtrC family response regulator
MDYSQMQASQTAKLLIVDDDLGILSQLSLALGKEYDVRTADSPETAWETIQTEHPDLVTLDLALDGVDPETGFSLLEKCLRFDPLMKVILVTGNDNEANALRAVEQGAADFFGKPVDVEELRVLLRRVLSMRRLERQNAALLKQLGHEQRLGELVGRSSSMRALYKKIEKVASVDIAVLILGDNGTGKELVAKEIRRLSSRATKPFVSINCGAIPENLLESELFGHERGAFTGAHASRPGRLEMAQGGIVLLDEIGELPISLQVKLLRFLQEHEIERVGGRSVIKLDVRVLAATSRDLEEEVTRGSFRQDLFYRLSVVNLMIPPLRDREEDILFLAQYFLDRYSKEFGRGPLTFTAKAELELRQHGWPGNVRELEHRIQKAVLMSAGRLVDAVDLELGEIESARQVSLREARQEADRQSIQDALRFTAGNISMAAKVLGISRPSLHALLTKLRIKAQDYKPRTAREKE